MAEESQCVICLSIIETDPPSLVILATIALHSHPRYHRSLYPWTNKYAVYPVGHPEFIYNPDTTDLLEYFGLAICSVLPPTRLIHPVLPYRCGGKLTFPLSRTCVEKDIDKGLHDKSLVCTHTDAERALTWTWCTPELDKAVEVGYVILKTHEVAHFTSKKQSLFESYVDHWLKLKVVGLRVPLATLTIPTFSDVHGFGPTRCALRQLSGRTLGGSPLQSAGRV